MPSTTATTEAFVTAWTGLNSTKTNWNIRNKMAKNDEKVIVFKFKKII